MSLSSAERVSTETIANEASLFVINLCASTTPMALVHPSSPELKRYTFFVTRQREEGRERFRLHMGYFASLFEAETLLVAVRDVYPAAWAGPAPTSGAPRKGRAATPVAAMASAVLAAEAAVPIAIAASVPAATAPHAAPAPEVSLAPRIEVAPEPAVIFETAPVRESPTLASMSNVGDVLLQLSDRAPDAPLPRLQPPPASIPTLSESQTLRVLEPLKAVPPSLPPAARKPFVKAAPAPSMPLPDIVPDEQQVRVMTPEDTQTLRDIRLDAERNAPPCFAVQLLWSVSPINIVDYPHLAIFDAYTLYNVEGNRQGRKWYGLRLGFFTDPNAATQVAYYIRSDYPTVAVVPVAERERDRAGGNEPPKAARTAAMPAPVTKPQTETSIEREGLDGFELLKDDRPVPVKRDVDDKPAQAPTVRAAPAKAAPKPAVKPAGKATGKRVMVRKTPTRINPGAAMPLEETLEMLGASTLTLDESREIINDSAIRTPISKKGGSGGRLSRLLNRLGGN